MGKFKLADGINRLSTEVPLASESIVLEAGKVYETDEPVIVAALRADANVIEHKHKAEPKVNEAAVTDSEGASA